MSIVDDLKKMDPKDPAAWPLAAKIIAFAVLFLGILAAGWKFDITKQGIVLADLEKTQADQLAILKTRQKKAANLSDLKDQMQEMQKSLGDLVRQLPNKTEVAGLLVDISQTGLATGLEFKLFEPKKEAPKEFYAELPINISVVGNYHQFGEFVSGIAALPRIVTTHDINIKPQNIEDGSDTPLLVMNTTVKTYRAIEEEEEKEN